MYKQYYQYHVNILVTGKKYPGKNFPEKKYPKNKNVL